MEQIEVGCAIIHKNGKLLIAQRHLQDSFGGFWEFPGGKREKDETIEACLEREVLEELAVRVRPQRLFFRKEHGLPDRKILLCFFFCEWVEGEPKAVDCKDFRWIEKKDLGAFRFLPGDVEVLADLDRSWDVYFKTDGNDR